jgi:hypothetical protein
LDVSVRTLALISTTPVEPFTAFAATYRPPSRSDFVSAFVLQERAPEFRPFP